MVLSTVRGSVVGGCDDIGMETVVQAYRYALDPSPDQACKMGMFAGASRFGYNMMLAEVKATLDARYWERLLLGGTLTDPQGWSLPALRRTWNANKNVWAPWWTDVSKEAFNHGLQCLADGLKNWDDSRCGRRKGAAVGFPRYKRRSGRRSFAYTTGSIYLLPDRHSVQLPRLGRVHTFESTSILARRLEQGKAKILRATVSCDGGRWYVSFTVEVERVCGRDGRPDHAPSVGSVVGVDVGVHDLLVVAAPDGAELLRIPAPRSYRAAQTRLGRLQRRRARQKSGSKRSERTRGQIVHTLGRAAHVRSDVLHKATTVLAQGCDTIVIEDLNVAGMGRRKRGLGARGRGFNISIADAAFGEMRRLLEYKAVWYGSVLVVADRWYPSTKTCSNCGMRKPSMPLGERMYECGSCGFVVDRDLNAATNLARLGGTGTGSGPAASRRTGDGRGAGYETEDAQASDAGGDEASTRPEEDGTAPPQGEAA